MFLICVETLYDVFLNQGDELLEFAIRAASITCSRRGADLPHLNELDD